VLGLKIKRIVKGVAAYTMFSAVGLTLIAYAADYCVFRYRVSKNQAAFGQVTVNHYDAVQQKNGKTEFLFDPPQVETCVNSLFPRAALKPCWYLQSHTEPRTNI
jgi:hypothetical protein